MSLTSTSTATTRPGPAALFVLLLASTLSVMAGAVVAPVLQLIRTELGVSATAAGLVLTAHALVVAVVSPAIGSLIDRYGVRGPLAAGLVVYGVGGGSALLATSYPVLLASRIVFGVGAAAVFTGTTVALLTLYRGAARDRLMGWRSSAMSLGGVAWPLAGGALGTLAWQGPFATYLVGIPLGLLVLLVLPADRPAPSPASSGPGAGGGVRRLVRATPSIAGLAGLLVLLSVLLYTIVVLLPTRLSEVGVAAPFLVGAISVGTSAAMTVAGLGYGWLRARLGYPVLLRLAAVTWTLAFGALSLSGNVVVIGAATVVFGLGLGVAIPAVTVLIADSAPARYRGQATSLTATATFVGQPLAPLIVGPVVDATTTTAGFAVAGGLSAVALLVLTVAGRGGRNGGSVDV